MDPCPCQYRRYSSIGLSSWPPGWLPLRRSINSAIRLRNQSDGDSATKARKITNSFRNQPSGMSRALFDRNCPGVTPCFSAIGGFSNDRRHNQQQGEKRSESKGYVRHVQPERSRISQIKHGEPPHCERQIKDGFLLGHGQLST
jgi:hypothetical protein